MLSVKGFRRQLQMFPETPSLEFFVNLLEKHWTRIRDLQIDMSPLVLESGRIWKALGRPAPLLQTFSCSVLLSLNGGPGPSSLQNLPPNYQLFSNHAPSLVKLILTPFPPIGLNITTPTLCPNSLRHLIIAQPLKLTDTDLLTACMQLPHIEELSLSLSRFVRGHPSDINPLRPPVPRLKWITLTDADPCIYSTFLDRIIPSPGCRLVIGHRPDAWSILENDQLTMENIAHMHRVVARYLTSYIEHRVSRMRKVKLMLQLTVIRDTFIFVIPEHHKRFCFRIARNFGDHVPLQHYNVLLILFESLLTVNVLESITALEFVWYSQDSFLSRAPPLQAFHSMSSVTLLNTSPDGLSYLARLKQQESLFPHLHIISLTLHYAKQDVNMLRTWIQPFLTHRLHTAPVKVLELRISYRRKTDLRFLDTLSGLKIVMYIYRDPSPLEYVCGSGDKQQLYVVQANSQ